MVYLQISNLGVSSFFGLRTANIVTQHHMIQFVLVWSNSICTRYPFPKISLLGRRAFTIYPLIFLVVGDEVCMTVLWIVMTGGDGLCLNSSILCKVAKCRRFFWSHRVCNMSQALFLEFSIERNPWSGKRAFPLRRIDGSPWLTSYDNRIPCSDN